MDEKAPPGPNQVKTPRLASIDLLRGLVMVVMALDHTRDYFSGATFDPTDLAKTDGLWFLTRWITHFCAPVFVLLTGTGAYLSLTKGSMNRGELSIFLLKRGLWLVFLEVAVVSPLGWAFRLDWTFNRLQVIWVIGISMMVLGALIQMVPAKSIGALGLALIAAHNLFDGNRAAWLGDWWKLLHEFYLFRPIPGKVFASLYPLVPWVGVMALGYGIGSVFLYPAEKQHKWLIRAGTAAIALFLLLRLTNIYGDPRPWTPQNSGLLTALSLLNVNKYPPSLLYLCMTLGPAALFLAWSAKLPEFLSSPLVTLGRVPLFYYLIHLPVIHGLAVLFSYFRHGDAVWLFQDPFVAGRSAHPFPPGYGYSLGVVWLVWIAVVLALYPICRWYSRVKSRSRHPLLSYL